MVKIEKAKSDPQSLKEFKESRVIDGQPQQTTYTDLRTPYMNNYKRDLLKEQNYLCAYCNVRLDDYDDDSQIHHLKIEHWFPQSLCKTQPKYNSVDGLGLQHDNLLLVCSGDSVNPDYKHCDSSRKARHTLTIKPQADKYLFEEVLNYEGTKLVSNDKQIEQDIDVELNLNDRNLLQKRFITLSSFRKNLLQLGRNNWNKEALIAKYSKPFKDGKKQQYCTLILHEILTNMK